PTFPTCRLTGAVPSFSPAASPHLRRRPSAWPPGRTTSPASESHCPALRRACTAARPISTRLEPVLDLRGVDHWFSSAYTFPSRLPDPGRLAVPPRPVVVRAAPTLPSASQVRLPPASTACCDRPQTESFHLRPDTWSLVAHRRLPVVGGCLHRHQRHPMAARRIGQAQQRTGRGGVVGDLLAAACRVGLVRDPDAARQGGLAEVERGDTLDAVHCLVGLLHLVSSRVGNEKAAREAIRANRKPDSRARSDSAGPFTRLPASDCLTGSAAPRTSDVSGRPSRFSARHGRPTRDICDCLRVVATPGHIPH